MKIIASWDDGHVNDLKVAELMEKYDIPTTFYWTVYPQVAFKHKVNFPTLDDAQQKKIAKKHTIGSHTVSHPLLTRIKLMSAWEEISMSRVILQEKFKQDIDSFCYPRGYANPAIEVMVAEAGYKTARGVDVGYIYRSENPYYQKTTLHVYPRKEYPDGDWLAYGIHLLEGCKGIIDAEYHIWGHSYDLDKYDDWDKLDKFLKMLVEERDRVYESSLSGGL